MKQAYIDYHKNAWSESTKRSEESRLNKLEPYFGTDPETVYDSLAAKYKPYALKTMWVRLVKYYDWLIAKGHHQGPNEYREYMERNRRLFKHVYERRQPSLSYRQVTKRIESIEDGAIRQECRRILTGGLRLSERHAIAGGQIVGKGGKRRPYFGDPRPAGRHVKESEIRRELRMRGLTPHDLRKTLARHLYEKGLSEIDITYIMGWSDFSVARSYIRPSKNEEIKEKMGVK